MRSVWYWVWAVALVVVVADEGRAVAQAPATASSSGKTILAETNWTFGFEIPEELGGKRLAKTGPKADVMVWVPEGTKRIRAMLLIPNNSDSKNFGEHHALHKVAAKHEMGIVYLRNFDTKIEHTETPDPGQIDKLLAIVAKETGIPEFQNAPWITFGKSSRGEFPFRMAWLHPKRTIASVTYHGETPTWPVRRWAKLDGETIPEVNLNGETEWGGTWFNHVRPSLLNYRAKSGWLPHLAIAKDVGHGDYPDTNGTPGWGKPFPGKTTCIQVWDYLSVCIDKYLDLRVPTDNYATNGPIALKQVDVTKGYLLDPFAVEDLFRVPHLPLREGPDGYITGGAEELPVRGFLAMSPLKDFAVAEGVPVVKLEPGQSPREWLITDSLKFAMQADPMVELSDPLRKLMPKPGDEVEIDGKKLSFMPISPKQVAKNGGIALNTGLRPANAKITLLAYTVLDVPAQKTVRVNAGFTAATRIQLVLNGVTVKDKQVLELQPGRYPLLVVLRMTVNWDRIEPSLGDVSDKDVATAKQMQAEADAFAAEQAKAAVAGKVKKILINKASDVPAEEAKKMFWVADREQAEAWFKLMAVHGQKFEDYAK